MVCRAIMVDGHIRSMELLKAAGLCHPRRDRHSLQEGSCGHDALHWSSAGYSFGTNDQLTL